MNTEHLTDDEIRSCVAAALDAPPVDYFAACRQPARTDVATWADNPEDNGRAGYPNGFRAVEGEPIAPNEVTPGELSGSIIEGDAVASRPMTLQELTRGLRLIRRLPSGTPVYELPERIRYVAAPRYKRDQDGRLAVLIGPAGYEEIAAVMQVVCDGIDGRRHPAELLTLARVAGPTVEGVTPCLRDAITAPRDTSVWFDADGNKIGASLMLDGIPSSAVRSNVVLSCSQCSLRQSFRAEVFSARMAVWYARPGITLGPEDYPHGGGSTGPAGAVYRGVFHVPHPSPGWIQRWAANGQVPLLSLTDTVFERYCLTVSLAALRQTTLPTA